MIDGHRWCSEGLDMYVRSIHMYTYIHSILLVRIYIFQILYIYTYIYICFDNMFAAAILLMRLLNTTTPEVNVSYSSGVFLMISNDI